MSTSSVNFKPYPTKAKERHVLNLKEMYSGQEGEVIEADTANHLDSPLPNSLLECRLKPSQNCAETMDIPFKPLCGLNSPLTMISL